MTDSKQSEIQPNIESLGPVPEDLAGFQNVVTGRIKFGDLITQCGLTQRFKFWADEQYIGDEILDSHHAMCVSSNYEYSACVYRKIPVAKQGACDEAWKAVANKCAENPAELRDCAITVEEINARFAAQARNIQDKILKVPCPPIDVTPYFIPQDDARRKAAPMARGLLHYFPAALFEIAAHSLAADLKHNGKNPDGPTWARGKSSDHEDCIVRHTIDAGKPGTPGRMYHLTARAWRALAALQEECEREGATPGVSSVFPQ